MRLKRGEYIIKTPWGYQHKVTHRTISGHLAIEACKQHGIPITPVYWGDPRTNAYGLCYLVRRRYLNHPVLRGLLAA